MQKFDKITRVQAHLYVEMLKAVSEPGHICYGVVQPTELKLQLNRNIQSADMNKTLRLTDFLN